MLLCWLVLLASCAPTGVYHTVQPGQTLYRIAKTYGVEERELARVNRIGDPTSLKVDQRLFIPGVIYVRNVPATASTQPAEPVRSVSPSPPPVTKATKPPAVSTAWATSQTPVLNRPASAAKSPATPTKQNQNQFDWPARGKILNRFGKNGQKTHKGIEISLPAGSSVVAAAPGKVIFSGNAIRSYGNLVILEHSGGFFSVYGYNKKNLVALDDHVGQGDKIALSGSPPSGQSPRLHFEIRLGKEAVDPIIYLP